MPFISKNFDWYISQENKVTGRKADALLAAHYAAEAALRLVKPGNEVNCSE